MSTVVHCNIHMYLIQLKEAACSEEETKATELRKKLSDMEMACQVHVFYLYTLVERSTRMQCNSTVITGFLPKGVGMKISLWFIIYHSV